LPRHKDRDFGSAQARRCAVLHCSTESILFRRSPSDDSVEDSLLTARDMPGPYTRSKMLAEQLALQAARSGFPVVIGTPTMPIGPHDHNLTPPTAMLRHFLGGRFQLYLDFIVNLVDVRDVAAGLVLAMERGQAGHRYLLGGESIRSRKFFGS
jgi:dihydroflavonol-4-reductase